jgi:hypothetical protein
MTPREEVQLLRRCMLAISLAAEQLPTFEIRHEGDEEAATRNIIDAITAAAAALPARQEGERTPERDAMFAAIHHNPKFTVDAVAEAFDKALAAPSPEGETFDADLYCYPACSKCGHVPNAAPSPQAGRYHPCHCAAVCVGENNLSASDYCRRAE